MASGVKVEEVVKLKYDDIKKKKSYRYLVFYIKDEKAITVEKVGDRSSNYEQFLADLTGAGPEDCRSVGGRQETVVMNPLDESLAIWCIWLLVVSGYCTSLAIGCLWPLGIYDYWMYLAIGCL